MSEFKDKIIHVIRWVPRGKVISYGQIAIYIGVPRAARQVGWTMGKFGGKVDIPWWRVVNNAGRISIRGSLYNDKSLQRKLLETEGIEISDDYTFDIDMYRFYPTMELLKEIELDKEYLHMLQEKYFIV